MIQFVLMDKKPHARVAKVVLAFKHVRVESGMYARIAVNLPPRIALVLEKQEIVIAPTERKENPLVQSSKNGKAVSVLVKLLLAKLGQNKGVNVPIAPMGNKRVVLAEYGAFANVKVVKRMLNRIVCVMLNVLELKYALGENGVPVVLV